MKVQSDVTRLGALICLDPEPESATWQTVRIGPDPGGSSLPGPSDYHLIAVLRYDPSIVSAIQISATVSNREIYVDQAFLKDWYPQSVVDSFASESGNTLFTVGVPCYNPTPFARSPWLDGYFFIADPETVFLFLATR